MSDFDNQLFTKVCELEARLELQHKKVWETEQKLVTIEQLLLQALDIIKAEHGIQETTRNK